MNESVKMRWAFAVFPLAGMVAASVTIWVRPHLFHQSDDLGGGIFGILMAACFWAFFGLRSMWKTAVFITASIIASYLSVLSALFFPFGTGEPFLAEMFVGGAVGAFVILSTAWFILSPAVKVVRGLLTGLCWSLVGGLLGVAGTLAGPLFGSVRMRLDPHHPDSHVSLVFVWQMGMGFVIAVMLWVENRRVRAGSSGRPSL